MAHNTDTTKKKGRPKSEETKKHHFTVWVSEIQKKEVQKLVQTSGLSASEFFLHLALNHRLKLPKRKGLPATVLDRIQLLEKLSGVLTLIAIKTKDKDLLSNEWLESSTNVKQISTLLLLWIFEDFDFSKNRITLKSIEATMAKLKLEISKEIIEFKAKEKVIKQIESIEILAKSTLENYEKYFQVEYFDKLIPKEFELNGLTIHEKIKEVLTQIKH
jgi:hypothetical protein